MPRHIEPYIPNPIQAYACEFPENDPLSEPVLHGLLYHSQCEKCKIALMAVLENGQRVIFMTHGSTYRDMSDPSNLMAYLERDEKIREIIVRDNGNV